MSDIKKVLIANRGEIAARVIRTCRDMGIATVAVYSDPDQTAPHVLLADESVHIGPAASAESYLDMDKIVDAARQTGAEAVHPGYGFLSEKAGFSQRCQDEGLIFIGPDPQSITDMGDKTRARDLMKQAGVPTPPGTKDALEQIDEARKVADEIGYPVLVKAAAGGGGKGMRVISDPGDLESGVRAAKSEAKTSFGDDRVYVEKYLESPHHVEFQVLADRHGNVLHIFDRECSIQRRHQKVVEEAPSPFITEQVRQQMGEAAVNAAAACGYVGAGTVEFLVDKHLNFYFLEMNTRLQVEHPVTEMITGLDLVEQQIRVARGEKLAFSQEELTRSGHAIECRVSAEDPASQFMPDTGTVTTHIAPAGNGVRVDSGVREGQQITIDYDPMISKLVVHGADRSQAIERTRRALAEYEIAGVRTTIPFCEFVMTHLDFTSGNYDTHFVQNRFSGDKIPTADQTYADDIVALSAALMYRESEAGEQKPAGRAAGADRVDADPAESSQWWRRRRG